MNRFTPAVDLDRLAHDPTLLPARWQDPTIGRFTSYDDFEGDPNSPLHLHKYAYGGGNPVNSTDPDGHDFGELLAFLGVTTTTQSSTQPTTRPATRAATTTTAPALAATGNGTWGKGVDQIQYQWEIKNVTGDPRLAGSVVGQALFFNVKIKKQVGSTYTSFLWSQYSEALQGGAVYVDTRTGWPWKGIDRYPNNARHDPDPYTYLPAEQAQVDAGNAYGGLVAHLYNSAGFDSAFVDLPSSGGFPNWGHYSVVNLLGQRGGKDYRIGSLVFEWGTDGRGNLTAFGARQAMPADVVKWKNALQGGYVSGTFGGDAP